MTTDAERLVSSYLSWIRHDVEANLLDDVVTELTTPFVDRHNDHLQVYAERKSSDIFLLTDDGYILCDWTESTIRAYQLTHILLHELGHHHDFGVWS